MQKKKNVKSKRMSFEEKFKIAIKLLKQFKKKYGHVSVPSVYRVNDFALGTFFATLRRLHFENNLDKKFEKQLVLISPTWYEVITKPDSFPEYCVYKIMKKYFPSVILHDISHGFELDVFVKEFNLAIEYDGGHHTDKYDADILKNLKCEDNNIFLIRLRASDIYLIPYVSEDCFQIFVEKSNDMKRTFRNVEYSLNLALSIFFNSVPDYNFVKNYFSDEQIDSTISEYINIIPPRWIYMYEFLESIHKTISMVNIPQTIKAPNGQLLHLWCARQREARKKGTICEKQIQPLDKLNFEWNPKGDAWENNYNLLLEYVSVGGDINRLTNKDTYKGKRLGAWLFKQRQSYRQKLGLNKKDRRTISDEEVEKLEKLGIDWRVNGHERYWNNGLARKVRNVETGEVFESIAAARRSYNNKDIARAIRTSGTADGYHWEFVTDGD